MSAPRRPLINAVAVSPGSLPTCRRCRKVVDALQESDDYGNDAHVFVAHCHGETDSFVISQRDLAEIPFSVGIDAIVQPFADPPGRFHSSRQRPAPAGPQNAVFFQAADRLRDMFPTVDFEEMDRVTAPKPDPAAEMTRIGKRRIKR